MHEIHVGELRLIWSERKAIVRGIPLSLSCREYMVLEALAWCEGSLVTREFLIALVYPCGASRGALRILISRIRSKLSAALGGVNFIHPVRNAGYTLKGPRDRPALSLAA